MRRRRWIGAAVALAAASSGVVVPALRPLVEAGGGGPAATGGLIAAHVLGGAAGAAAATQLARRLADARALIVGALVASAVLILAVALPGGVAPLIVVRFVEGACHLLAITTAIAVGVTGDARVRTRRAAVLGLVLVLGVGLGLGVGGLAAWHAPETAVVVAAGLAAAAAVSAARGIPGGLVLPARGGAPGGARGPVALPPALIALGERFTFGVLAVSVPFAMGPRRSGLVLGGFMLASVVAIPIGRCLVERWGARDLARRAAVVLAPALAAAGAPGLLTGPMVAAWALLGGLAAGALYAAALGLVASHAGLGERMAAMGAVHAAGNAGHALGAVAAGALLSVATPAVVVAAPTAAVVALGVAAASRALPRSGGAGAAAPRPHKVASTRRRGGIIPGSLPPMEPAIVASLDGPGADRESRAGARD